MTAETLEVECRNGHSHAYPGPAGRAVKCRTRECRVSLWIPKGARVTSSTGAGTLAALWALEGPAGRTMPADPAPYDVPCATCDGERVWEGRRTLVYCPTCNKMGVPRFVLERLEQRQDDEQTTGQEIAVRGPSPAEVRQAEVALAGHRASVVDSIHKALDALRVDDLPDSQTRRDAVRWHGALSSYVGHVVTGWPLPRGSLSDDRPGIGTQARRGRGEALQPRSG